MKTMILFLMLILVFCGNNTFSQINNENIGPNFGFYAGISHYQGKERSINGLVHSGPGFNAAFVLSYKCSNSIHRLELMAGLNFLKTYFESETGSFLIQSFARYSIISQVASLKERFNLFIGGQAKLRASQGIYTNWDVNHFYWLTSYSLGFNGIANYEISNKSAISVELGLPLLSLISRTPESLLFHEANPEFLYVVNQVHQNPSIEFPLNHFNPELKLAYHRDAGKKAIQTIFWRFSYIDNNVEGSCEIKIMNHAFGVEFLF
jgi:hypothetical protein